MKFLSLLLLALWIFMGDCIDLSCPDGIITFDFPDKRSNETWYPKNFQDSQPPMFPMNFECEYQINVPEGWFAEIDLTLGASNEDGSAPVQIIDDLQGMEKVSSAAGKTYFLISGGGKIKISTKNKNYRFGFSVYWDQYFSSRPGHQEVSKNDNEPLIFTFGDYRPSVIKAETHVSASVMPPPDDNAERLLRGTLFFDGPSSNSTCIGTGLQLLNRKTQFVSSGNTMTILFLGYYTDYINVKILIQNYEIIKNFKELQGLYCYDDKDCGTVTMDASHGPSVLQTLAMGSSATDVVMKLEGTGKLHVYSGGINEDKLLIEYSSPFDPFDFPQEFRGKVKTYVLREGKLDITITRKTRLGWETENYGRKGISTSNHYGMETMSQDSFSVIEAPNGQFANFEYSIEMADLTDENAVFVVFGQVDWKMVHTARYDFKKLPKLNEVQSFEGKILRFQYVSGRANTKGFKAKYRVLNNSSNFQFMTVFTLIFSVFFIGFL